MAEAPSFTGEVRMLIDGKLVEADSGKRFENINPANEEVLGEVADASATDMRRAIAAARRAFDETDWATNRALRKRCLEQLQEALEAEREELREELIAEVGAPRMVTYTVQLDTPLEDGLRYPAKMIEEFPWERDLPNGAAFGMNSQRQVWKEPMGVVGAIVPWNFPFEVTIGKIGQILATGNTTVLKPAPDTPWNATRLGRLVAEKTDIPPGVFNVVTSSDHLVGEELTLSPLVDMISFTGSTVTGKRIMEKGAATMKRVFLELGGKSAMIVLDDADFATAVPSGSMVCMHAGQGCAMQSRMLLPRSRYDEGVELITQAMSMVPYGDPSDPNVMMGPLVSAKQRDPRPRLHRQGSGGRGQARARRRPAGAVPEGLLGGADAVRRRGQLDDHRPGGDLRPRLGRDPVRGRRRRRAHRQRQRLRPLGWRALGERGAGDGRRAAHPYGVDQRQRRDVVRGGLALRRIQGQRCRPPERSRRIRAVPRDEGHRLAAALTATHLR